MQRGVGTTTTLCTYASIVGLARVFLKTPFHFSCFSCSFPCLSSSDLDDETLGATWKHVWRACVHHSCMSRHAWTVSCIHIFSRCGPTSGENASAWMVHTQKGLFSKIWLVDQKKKKWLTFYLLRQEFLEQQQTIYQNNPPASFDEQLIELLILEKHILVKHLLKCITAKDVY